MKKIRWGVLSTAKIAREKFIPAVQKSQFGDVVAIASRSMEKAENTASELGIGRAYGSYEELLDDPEIDAVYNPLPNDMHVPWTIRSMDLGKHVLCEKPIALNARQAEQLLQHAKTKPDILVMEAFMYRFHPQWQMVRSLVDSGSIGHINQVNSLFTYFKDDPSNIRTDPEKGGGGLMDIGCYCVSIARWLFNHEPLRAFGSLRNHPQWHVDILANAILDFGEGRFSSFTCGTQSFPDQYVEIIGNHGRIRVNRPVNVPSDMNCTIDVENENGTEIIEVVASDHYTLQADYFSRSILDQTEVPTPLEDAYNNMKVIEAIFKSAESLRMENIPSGSSH
ncbi:Gfo/Idh/MocA family protein [Fulvivirga sedimenti]|uniref:Gfo/Idh/MocA family oxidoreductase n=1 Tax=Fulvivirga sedimenti TaxID=2879465 RepID=A0A9X1HP92_9BACT|nr:Gfo/Idh/MocA family oxidoreductase [Fulvivirga sedimenti]MCA6075435.1 Gfo/Idh/MocA family oxidoreductase [Fulvivirga sedimenti]MCA6076612.1 Gfo/Idh/MocA family oxidoreductase [Fulvivirga sedimenti]MCA6077740.1 Gfo/Idh/MocA family oxidoreductase [Fulvivirga sedimenti]